MAIGGFGRCAGQLVLANHHLVERPGVGVQRHQNADQGRQRDAMEEHVAQNAALVPVPVGRSARHHDALRVNHLAHHAARTVGGAHQHWTKAGLLGCDLLQAAEQHIRRGVRTRERHAQPTLQRAEKRIQHARLGHGQPQRRVRAGIFSHVAQREHPGNGQQRIAHAPDRLSKHPRHLTRRKAHR